MEVLLILTAVISFTVNATATRAFQIKYPNNKKILRMYQALFCLFAAALFLGAYLVGAAEHRITFADLFGGALFGLFYYAAVVFTANGYETGSMSLTSVILNMSLFIPLVYSCIVFGDSLNTQRVIGIVLVVLTMLLCMEVGGQKRRASLVWFLMALGAFVTNGMTSVLQKDYVFRSGEQRVMLYMSTAYVASALLFFINSAVIKGERTENPKRTGMILVGAAVVSGLGSFGGNALMGHLCNKVDGTVLYPCINGGFCILCALVSFLLFREKPTRRKLLAIAVGTAAIVLLCI